MELETSTCLARAAGTCRADASGRRSVTLLGSSSQVAAASFAPLPARGNERRRHRANHGGAVALSGTVPNGQRAVVLPRRLYPVVESRATLAGETLGRPGPVPENPAIGGFRLPARPVFAVGRAYFEILDPAEHARTAAEVRRAAGAAGRGLVDRG